MGSAILSEPILGTIATQSISVQAIALANLKRLVRSIRPTRALQTSSIDRQARSHQQFTNWGHRG
ncbi:MAG: hypothetical protein SWY16_10480 [Cyanobacteriota bacterium]|nr:hypothetical protein [Cyanobacteriota bacterium]